MSSSSEYIEFKGIQYTPLEFAALVAELVPEQHKNVVDIQRQLIKQSEHNIREHKQLIKLYEKHDPTNYYLPKLRAQLANMERIKKEREWGLRVLLSSKDTVKLLSEKVKQEVGEQ